MAQRWHGLLLLLARSTQQGRAGQAGQALAIAGSKAGQSSTGNGISDSEMKHLKKNLEMVVDFQKTVCL
jgi:hypothetical protein